MTTKRRIYKPRKTNLLNMLNEKSLSVIKQFGYIYKDPNTGNVRMRPFRNFNRAG